MAASILQSESTLTDRYQTTIPDAVRKVLLLGKRDKMRYTILPDGGVVLSKINPLEEDPALDEFLSFLVNDIHQNPQHIRAVNQDLFDRAQLLVSNVMIDLDQPLPDDKDS